MHKQLFLNLPVANVDQSLAFYQALGYAPNPQFTGDGAACVTINDAIAVMLLSHDKFRHFSPKEICDTSKALQVLLALTCESRAEVDELVARATANGGATPDQAEDYGFMYTHSFVDPDGHGWGLVHMTPPQG